MAAPKIKLYTYEDYKKWEGSWEIIDGIPYAMAPAPLPRHQIIVGRVFRELQESLNCENCEVFIAPIDWKIDEYNVVQPDVSIFCEDWENKSYLTSTPPIVVEVLSLSTIFKDLNTKYKLYEKAGVKYYVIINPENNEVKIFENKGEFKEVKFDKKFKFSWDDCSAKINFEKVLK